MPQSQSQSYLGHTSSASIMNQPKHLTLDERVKKRLSGIGNSRGLSIFNLSNYNRIEKERRDALARMQQ